MEKIAKIFKERKSSSPLKVYRTNLQKDQQLFEGKCDSPIKEESLFLMKSPYSDKFINVTFDRFRDNSTQLPIYLSEVRYINQGNYSSQYAAVLKDMEPTETFLFYVLPENKKSLEEALMIARVIELELDSQQMPGVKVFAI